MTCAHPGMDHDEPFSYCWPCPSCGICKFIGHGPLCIDCYVAGLGGLPTEDDTPTVREFVKREAERTTDLADERADIIARFTAELAKVTGDGSRKRQAGTKPPWYEDDSHEGAVFSHLMKWKRGELVDPDSGAHPLVHAGWRLLAIALRETGNVPNASLARGLAQAARGETVRRDDLLGD